MDLSLYNQDRDLPHDSRPRWSRPPRDNLKISLKCRRSGNDRLTLSANPAYREHRFLAIENGIRRELASIQRSWDSYGSAWRAWGSFMDSTYPMSKHFPADAWSIRAFASHFRNPDTLKQYLNHLRYAHHLLDLNPDDAFHAASARILRGSSIGHIRKPKGRIVASEVKDIVRFLANRGHILLARMIIIGRQWLFRIHNECLSS